MKPLQPAQPLPEAVTGTSDPASGRSVAWLHLRWGDTDVNLERRSTDGVEVIREPIGTLRRRHLGEVGRLRANVDAVLLEIPASPFQSIVFEHRNPLKNLLRLPFASGFLWKYVTLLRFLSRLDKPLVVFDLQDSAGIAARFLPIIRRAHAYHKRELPKFLANAFQHTEVFAIEPWRNRGRYAGEIAKLRPLSLGAAFHPIAHASGPRDIDIFWAGTVDNSPVRERGVKLLRELQREGLKVEIVEERMAKADFYERMGRSWLAFCPDGNGWQCWRTFEAASLGAAPLLPYPTVWQDAPFVGGEHCFYYNPDGNDLKQVARAALSDKTRLGAISTALPDFVRTQHTEAPVYFRHLSPLRIA